MSELSTTSFASMNEAIERLLDQEFTTSAQGTGADTLEVSEMVNNVATIADGGSAAAITTPTGAAIWAALKNPKVGDTFWFVLVNKDAGDAKTVTAGATGVTVIGTAAVAAASNGLFLCRLTAADTVEVYRV